MGWTVTGGWIKDGGQRAPTLATEHATWMGHERGAGSVHLGWYVEANRKVAVLSQEDSSGEGGTASHLEQPRLLAGFWGCT